MSRIVIGVIALVVGILVGVIGALTLGVGAIAGVGVATGLSAGICSTVRAAQEEGLMTAEQVDQVMNRAARDLAAITGVGQTEEIVGSAEACDNALARLREARPS